jgi:hypothetical protein
VDVYNYITAAVILYIPASRKLLQSSELYCAILPSVVGILSAAVLELD